MTPREAPFRSITDPISSRSRINLDKHPAPCNRSDIHPVCMYIHTHMFYQMITVQLERARMTRDFFIVGSANKFGQFSCDCSKARNKQVNLVPCLNSIHSNIGIQYISSILCRYRFICI